jgi:hypothetical protein
VAVLDEVTMNMCYEGVRRWDSHVAISLRVWSLKIHKEKTLTKEEGSPEISPVTIT